MVHSVNRPLSSNETDGSAPGWQRAPTGPSLLIGGDVGWDLGRPIHDGGTSFIATYEVLTMISGPGHECSLRFASFSFSFRCLELLIQIPRLLLPVSTSQNSAQLWRQQWPSLGQRRRRPSWPCPAASSQARSATPLLCRPSGCCQLLRGRSGSSASGPRAKWTPRQRLPPKPPFLTPRFPLPRCVTRLFVLL
jgi:hypothetical protein